MASNNEPSPRRVWAAERDGTPYELTLEGDCLRISYYSPPEYHYTLSDNCSLAEFVDGRISDSVRQVFGRPVLDQVLDIALAEFVREPPEGRH